GEARHDLVAQDAARERVGERSLEAVPDLEAGRAALREDEEDEPVLLLLLPRPPRLRRVDGVLLERRPVRDALLRVDAELVRGLVLEALELRLQLRDRGRREDARVVGDEARRRRRQRRSGRQRRQDGEDG